LAHSLERLASLKETAVFVSERGLGRNVPHTQCRSLSNISYYYLFAIGVDPLAQGKGCAGDMMRGFLAKADAEGVPCYLENSNPKNTAMYEHLGFVNKGRIVYRLRWARARRSCWVCGATSPRKQPIDAMSRLLSRVRQRRTGKRCLTFSTTYAFEKSSLAIS